MKPYYSYTATLPWKPCSGKYNYVVFHKDDAITISPQAYNILSGGNSPPGVIRPHRINSNKGKADELFYNAKGPIKPNLGEIYIDCQPTGDDGEVLVPARVETSGILDNEILKKMWNYTFVKIIIGTLVMILIWQIASRAIKGIASNNN